ncbi:MAG TPA: hypothetical protein VJ695_06430, partial [Nitrososphaera sp.]|nr:hypothetical protein [Nitrososphaera sp.]
SIGERQPMLFTVALDSPPALDIREIRVDEEQKKIMIDARLDGALAQDATIMARIPRTLVQNVSAAVIEGQQGSSAMEFKVNESRPDYTIISANIGGLPQDTQDIRLAIY